MEALCSFETSANNNPATQRNNPADPNPQHQCRENSKSRLAHAPFTDLDV
jgi:hypothetical protein